MFKTGVADENDDLFGRPRPCPAKTTLVSGCHGRGGVKRLVAAAGHGGVRVSGLAVWGGTAVGGQNDGRLGTPRRCRGKTSRQGGQPRRWRGETTNVMGWKQRRSLAALDDCPVALRTLPHVSKILMNCERLDPISAKMSNDFNQMTNSFETMAKKGEPRPRFSPARSTQQLRRVSSG